MKSLWLACLLAACAEVQESSPHVSRSQAQQPAPKAPAKPKPSAPEPSAPEATGPEATPARVTINEVSGDADWIELYNAGDDDASLAGLGVAPKKDDADAPDLDRAVRFADGESLAGHAFVLIACKKASASSTLMSDCLPSGGPATCYAATFGISDKDGEALFLLAADDSVTERVDYPKATVPKEQAWGRSADGGETFVISAPSPAASNASR